MKRIIVPCDFSGPAVHAFRFAVDVAAQSAGEVHLLHVIEVPVLQDSAVLSYDDGLFKELRAQAVLEMRTLTADVPDSVRVIHAIRFGPMHKIIPIYVAAADGDLIIMGTHGASGLREFFAGSNAGKVVRTSAVPVITVKDKCDGPVKRIVFPCTLENDFQEELAHKVKALQQFFQTHLHMVWINSPLYPEQDAVVLERLEAFAERLGFENYTVNIYHDMDAEAGILKFAHEIEADMIALGTHGRRGVAHFLHGSTAEDIVNHSRSMIWTSVMPSAISEY
ncbi:universal stress protein [Parachryseolinea silvisoli]|jgi:nucleotide-binding universal stress UspA family protein|uniref:universal stress protein n=1 Tax=Parachryseolinea silvisoli TaxID=2873601 RepID=UPI002265EED4|nr:universal stress protein [Parachryseolinea silvisoli]MCD9018616.1 universal stress protein [Parachryseolinea silvisoli]